MPLFWIQNYLRVAIRTAYCWRRRIEQHYEDVDYFFNDDFTFEDQQIRDQTLRDYCRKNNIQLLEIPYTEFDKIDEILTNTLLRPKEKD